MTKARGSTGQAPSAVHTIGSIRSYPARVLAVWYLGLILLGAVALMYPGCQGDSAQPLSFLDAVFTSTSATCVTGLVVRSTGHDFSGLGQAVILLLIQVGGIGIMTVTTYVMFTMGRSASLRHRAVLSTTMGTGAAIDLRRILRNTLAIMLIAESLGFAILALRNLLAGVPWRDALWPALFHTVSAFCNAGFALPDDSLVKFQQDIVVNLTIMALIVTGGMGFPVILDIKENWQRDWTKPWERLSLHTKLMVIGTSILLVLGMASFLLFEWHNALGTVPIWLRPMVALFHSVTCRTAGFNTVNVAGLTNATLLVSMLLMAVGAGPGSTAGGFKVSTLAILALRAWASLRGRELVSIFRHTIPRETVVKAMVTAMLFATIGVISVTALLAFEQSQQPYLESAGLFLDASFEVTSALGTVGLSTGLTSELSSGGRVIIILLMFMGRLGPITVFTALSRSDQREPIEFSSAEPLIG